VIDLYRYKYNNQSYSNLDNLMQQSYKWNIFALKRMRNSYKLGKVVVWEYDY
jgi:hypothetical protein